LPVAHAHQAGAHPVVHVADQDAVLDQDGAFGGRALVVDGQRAATAGERAVVEHGDALGGHPLADAAGEGADALAVEVAFQAVADGLVQQHAVPARAQHHVHLAGGAGHGVEVDQRHAQGLVDLALPLVGADPGREAGAAAGPGRAGSRACRPSRP
jgi:hypothetical protein